MKIIVKHLLTLMLLWFVIPLHAQHDVCRKEITLSESSSSTLVAFFPEQPSGRAVVALWDDVDTQNVQEVEAKDWASFFVQRGISFFVVKYSQPDAARSQLVVDAEKAVKMVRDSAAVWHINPYDVGIMGCVDMPLLSFPHNRLLPCVLTLLCCSILSFLPMP